tara:strand:+ start:186 stop:422 length:237 start_codon:yes stop_codon:yes gene_type:complete
MSGDRNNARLIKEYKSKYKGVYLYRNTSNGKDIWSARFYHNNKTNSKNYPTERAAAVAVDVFRLNHGKEAVNVLVRKT